MSSQQEVGAREVVLATVAYSPDQKVGGRTLLQKLVYFVNEFNDLGIPFDPAYYGPYSAVAARATNSLVALGFLSESETTYPSSVYTVFPVCKHTYRLTEEGCEVFKELETKVGAAFAQIEESIGRMWAAGSVDYVSLSLAAKMTHILKTQHPNSMKKVEIMAAARELKWELTEEAIEKAADFLIELKRVKVVDPK